LFFVAVLRRCRGLNRARQNCSGIAMVDSDCGDTIDELSPRIKKDAYAGAVKKFDAQRGGVYGNTALLLGGHAEDPDDNLNVGILRQRRKSFSALVTRKQKPNIQAEDLTSVREYLMSALLSTKQELLAKISHTTTYLESELTDYKDKMARDAVEQLEMRARDNAMQQQFTTECAQRLAHDLSATRYTIEDRLHRSFELTKINMQEMQHHNNMAQDGLQQLIDRVRAEHVASQSVRWTTTMALLNSQRKSCDDALENQRTELKAEDEAHSKRAAENLADAVEKQRQRDAQQDGCLIENHNDLKRCLAESDSNFGQYASSSDGNMDGLKKDVNDQVAAIRSDADQRLKTMEIESQRLFTVVSEVENIPTRRVEWVIKDASRLSLDNGKNWLSPKFEAAGAHSLQLEFRTVVDGKRASDSPPLGEEDPSGRSFGDCGVYLWAADSGLRLVCKLYVGRASATYTHTFDGGAPCGATRFGCFFRDQIGQDDTLKVGIEILEAVREVENLPRPQSPGGSSRKRNGEVLDGPVMSHRYLNHRTLELVQNQVDLMRSRMVRRIEWRLQQASMLPRCFPEGESLCSTTFEAAGVGEMQLVFYPSGYAGVKEGYCSFFLHCPAGSSLRCWLVAGKQRREAKLEFEQAGFFGRTNFCRYENCIDSADDSILLVLEIDEAQQHLTESMWHQPVAQQPATKQLQQLQQPEATGQVGQVSTDVKALQNPGRPRTGNRGASGPGRPPRGDPPRPGQGTPPQDDDCVELPDKIDSSVKLTRAPGKIALEDVKQLPSIWTSRPQGNITEALEGFHNFENLAHVKKPMSARGKSRQFNDRIAAAANGVMAEKVAPRFLMYAA